MKLLTLTAAKTVKGQARGYLTGILYLAPAYRGTCPWSTAACRAVCLGTTSGRMRFEGAHRARQRRTDLLRDDRPEFERVLDADIRAVVRKAERENLVPCFRLNGTSDLPYLAAWADRYPLLQFYDYTKQYERMLQPWAPNYHCTYSYTRAVPMAHVQEIIERGRNVAVVFQGLKPTEPLPATWEGFPVHDADTTDLRFLDPAGSIAGLRAKGTFKAQNNDLFVRLKG